MLVWGDGGRGERDNRVELLTHTRMDGGTKGQTNGRIDEQPNDSVKSIELFIILGFPPFPLLVVISYW